MLEIRRSISSYVYLQFSVLSSLLNIFQNSLIFPIWVLTAHKNTPIRIQTGIYHNSIIIRKIRPKGYKHESSHNYKRRQKSKNKLLFLTLYKVCKNMISIGLYINLALSKASTYVLNQNTRIHIDHSIEHTQKSYNNNTT